jgi:hypothetical protein
MMLVFALVPATLPWVDLAAKHPQAGADPAAVAGIAIGLLLCAAVVVSSVILMIVKRTMRMVFRAVIFAIVAVTLIAGIGAIAAFVMFGA